MYRKTKKILLLAFFILLSVAIIPQGISHHQIGYTEDINHDSSTTYHLRIFYIGQVENVYKSEDLVEFDAVHILRYTHMFTSDHSFWSFSIAHYEETHISHEDYRFFGILTNSFILGMFTKTM